ncbi:5281_t:CDS:2, partial [Entrophospora sp. SA101]
RIKQLRHTNRTQAQIIGPVEEDPEYELIVQANNITVDIDNEILVVHKFIRDHYAKKFPELESLVLNPYDYTRAVKAIGNEMDLTKIDLRSILPSATVMVVTVTGSTTNGQQLTEEENTIVSDACDMVLELDSAKREILEYVDSRMTLIAPNLSAIVGSTTAAKILGQAGGLTALCKMPACNVMLIGTQKKLNTGFSNVTAPRHTGYLYQSELIQRTPTDLRTKAQKIVAAKCTLAARMDRMHESSDELALILERSQNSKLLTELDYLKSKQVPKLELQIQELTAKIGSIQVEKDNLFKETKEKYDEAMKKLSEEFEKRLKYEQDLRLFKEQQQDGNKKRIKFDTIRRNNISQTSFKSIAQAQVPEQVLMLNLSVKYLESQVNTLQSQLNIATRNREMLGEKTEKVEELQDIIDDMRDVYKNQITELASEVEKYTNKSNEQINN